MSDKEKLPPLERYIRILEILAAFPDGLSLTDIATTVELPKASVHRLLKTMQDIDLIGPARSGTMTYVVGSRIRKLMLMTADTGWIEVIARPYLTELTARTGETTFIAKLEGTAVRSVVMEAPDTPLRGFVNPGREMAPHAAASAKAILAFQDAETIERVLTQPLQKLTSLTTTSKIKVMKEYELVRSAGYATCIGEIDEGLAAVAVPIVMHGPEIIFSLGITGPLMRVKQFEVEKLATLLKSYAKQIANGLSVGIEQR